MKICCLSDLHGHLPEVPECDLLLLGGDYCPMNDVFDQAFWLRDRFGPWLASFSKRFPVIGVAGNHDHIWEKRWDLVPKLNWTYLQDSGTTFRGLRIWGSPWQPVFHHWAFNAEEAELAEYWSRIPEDTDILLLHGPPHGYGDTSLTGGDKFEVRTPVHTGSPSLLARIIEVKPRLVVAGHIHSGYGRYQIGDHTTFVNAALMRDWTDPPTNDPIIVDFKL